jgi:HEAT repeat protein
MKSLLHISAILLLITLAGGAASRGQEAPDQAGEVKGLIEALESDDAVVRYDARKKLARMGGATVPFIVRALDSGEGPEDQLIIVLGEIGPDASKAVPKIIDHLTEDGRFINLLAVEALERIGPSSLPHLASALEGKGEVVRMAACETISRFGARAHVALPALARLLGHSDWNARIAAVETLGAIGKKALPALLKAMEDPHAKVRVEAILAVGFIDVASPAVTRALTERLRDSDPNVRGLAAETLVEAETISIRDLLKSLGSGDGAMKIELLTARLTREAEFAEIAAEAETLLADESPDVRMIAARILGRCGEKGGKAAPSLAKALGDGDARVRREAASSLQFVGSEARVAIPALVRALTDSDPAVAEEAARALGALGELAAEAEPALMKAFREGADDIRAAAFDALLNIRKGEGDWARRAVTPGTLRAPWLRPWKTRNPASAWRPSTPSRRRAGCRRKSWERWRRSSRRSNGGTGWTWSWRPERPDQAPSPSWQKPLVTKPPRCARQRPGFSATIPHGRPKSFPS